MCCWKITIHSRRTYPLVHVGGCVGGFFFFCMEQEIEWVREWGKKKDTLTNHQHLFSVPKRQFIFIHVILLLFAASITIQQKLPAATMHFWLGSAEKYWQVIQSVRKSLYVHVLYDLQYYHLRHALVIVIQMIWIDISLSLHTMNLLSEQIYFPAACKAWAAEKIDWKL